MVSQSHIFRTNSTRIMRLIICLIIGVCIFGVCLISMSSSSSTDQSNKCLSSSMIKQNRFPAEWENHTRTVMIWPASEVIWEDLLEGVRKDIASIAKAIVNYEDVVVLANPNQVKGAQDALGSKIIVIPMEVDDLWARDTLPIFVENSEHEIYGIDFHFNGWGNKQEHGKDAKIASQVLSKYNLTCVNANIITEGGAIETDGQGTLLVTESSIVNDNRNPNKTRDEVEGELKELLGVSKVIWIKGVKGGDITDAHIDALARFASPGVVVLNKPFQIDEKDVWSISSLQAKEVLSSVTDAAGSKFKIVEITEPNPDKITGRGAEFLASYLNYYVANGVVIMPKFGDTDADNKAKSTLQELYPGREVVAINIDSLASGGGGIHCATHDMIGK